MQQSESRTRIHANAATNCALDKSNDKKTTLLFSWFDIFGCAEMQVQAEIKRKWRRWHLQRYMRSDTKYQHPSIGSSNNFSTQITMLTRCSPKTRRASSSCHDDLSSI